MKYTLGLFLIIFFSCNSNTVQNKYENTRPTIINHPKTITLNANINKHKGVVGDVFTIEISDQNHPIPDSTKLYLNDIIVQQNKKETVKLFWNSKSAQTGINTLKLKAYWGDSLASNQQYKIILKSDITPVSYSYKVINEFNHSHKNYTQGLEFNNGFLYEGTGQYGESMLFKTDIDKGEVLQSLNLPQEVFGEGITILNDMIYQITWRSSIGFVYNKNSFEKLYEFNYPTEGWGLTNNGKELIMSDGSENIYFLDTEFMQETKKLQVYDNNGPITNLNELELINDLIYANIYGSEEIVAFEIETGKVVRRINLKGILDKKDIKHPIDVLNGIAYDKETKRLLVTGKWWPKLYEIELIIK